MKDRSDKRVAPIRGVITHAAPTERGTPPGSMMRIEGGGLNLDVRHMPPRRATAVTAGLLRAIPFRRFDMCPICLADNPRSKEHVPQRALGGTVQTLTCTKCNNKLGALVESELTNWCFGIFESTVFSNTLFPGSRQARKILSRNTPDGRPVLVMSGNVDPAIPSMFSSGEITTAGFRSADPKLYRIAALKHAYLAACAELGYIPETARANEIRRDLLSARDAKKRLDIPPSEIASGLTLGRTFVQSYRGPSLLLVEIPSETDSVGSLEFGVALAGKLVVSWPLDLQPSRR